ncbi:MAG: FliM/FliN family flagellar motor switch protein [Pseudomonadota bacterium]
MASLTTATRQVEAYDWSALPQAKAQIVAFPPLAHPIEVALRGAIWTLTRGDADGPRKGKRNVSIPVQIDEATAQICFSTDPLPEMVGGPGGVPKVGALSADERSLLVRHLSHGPLAQLATLLDADVSLAEPTELVEEASLPFKLTSPKGKTFAVALRGPGDLIERVAALLPVAKDRLDTAICDVPIPIGLRGRSFALPLNDLQALCTGDALITPVGWSDTERLRVCITSTGEELAVRRDGDRLHAKPGPFAKPIPTILSETADMTDTMTRRSSEMSSEIDAQDTADTPPSDVTARHATLNVTVSLELDRATITIADLCALEEGGVLPFEAAPGGPVRLLANGAPFAEGELVRVEDRIGLRIAKIL